MNGADENANPLLAQSCRTPRHRVSSVKFRRIIMDASPVTRNKCGQPVSKRQKKVVLNVVKKMVGEPLQEIENIPILDDDSTPEDGILTTMRTPLTQVAKRTSDYTGISTNKVLSVRIFKVVLHVVWYANKGNPSPFHVLIF
jgi:hypothetical protein